MLVVNWLTVSVRAILPVGRGGVVVSRERGRQCDKGGHLTGPCQTFCCHCCSYDRGRGERRDRQGERERKKRVKSIRKRNKEKREQRKRETEQNKKNPRLP